MFKNVFFSTLTVAMSFVAVSCGPRDVAVEGGGGGNAGQPVNVSAQGQRSSTCPQNMDDHTNLRSPFELDQKVFSGKVTAALGAGDRNCFRIGSTVKIQNGNQGESRAQVVVKKVEAFPLTQLTSAHAAFFDMTLEELKALAEKEMSSAPFNTKGWVNITYFEYVQGSATVAPQSEGLTVVSKEGERSPTCPATMEDHTNLRSPVEFDNKVFAQKVTAALGAGDRNCFKIGSEVNLQNGANSPPRAKVKVLKVEVLSLALLKDEQAQALDMTLEELKALAEKEISTAPFNAKGMVNITYFKYLSGGTPTAESETSTVLVVDQEGERSSTCPATMSDHTNLRSPIEMDEKIFTQKVTAALGAGDRNCFRIGSVAKLQNGNNAPSRGEVKIIKVEVLSVENLQESQAVALDMSVEEIKALAQKEISTAPFDAKGKINITHFIYQAENGVGDIAGPVVVVPQEPSAPQVSETLYKLLASGIKSEVELRLSQALLQQGIAWDKASLSVTFERFVSIQWPLSSSAVLYPGYRVTFKTEKGNTLMLTNSPVSESPLWIMETSGRVEKITDVEGVVLNTIEKWYALPQTPLLVNQESQEKTKIDVQEFFNPFAIVVAQ